MNFRNLVIISVLGLILFSSNACTLPLGVAAVEPQELGHTIYLPPAKTFSPQQPLPQRTPSTSLTQPETENSIYLNKVREKFYQEQFLWLDAEAKRIRSSKERLHDGAWKLYILYAAVDNPNYANITGEEDWQRHLPLLHKWLELQPQSVTVRVALGEFFVNYGWHARGDGYSYKVTEEGWRQLGTRLAEAERV